MGVVVGDTSACQAVEDSGFGVAIGVAVGTDAGVAVHEATITDSEDVDTITFSLLPLAPDQFPWEASFFATELVGGGSRAQTFLAAILACEG